MVCGCEDIDVVNKIGLRWAVQLVARALQPGRYNESVLGLCAEGGGEGKSKFVRNIVYDKSLAYEGAPNLDNTQSAAQTLIGSWVVDFSEGEAVDRHSQETNKRFITQDFDKYVEKFENTNVSVKRPYAFVMTTNNETPLLELSIASVRRFQFVKVKKFDAKMMLKIRDQLYYEANQFLQLCDALRESGDNEPYILTDLDKEELVEYSKQFVKANTLTFQLREFFKDTVEPYYRVDEMLATARAYEPKCSPQILWNILRDELGFTKEKKKVSYQFNGEPTSQRTWVYVPPKSNATKIRVDDLNADQAAVINILEPNSKDVKSNLETQWLEQLHYMSKAKDLGNKLNIDLSAITIEEKQL
jgi:hypothetical protein